MTLKKSIEKIEREIAIHDDWDQLWDRYVALYRYGGSFCKLTRRSKTMQDFSYERSDRLLNAPKDIQEARLAELQEDWSHMSKKEVRYHATILAKQSQARCKEMTPPYARALKALSESSYSGYWSSDIDPVYRGCLKREVGSVSYRRLDRAVSQCERITPGEMESKTVPVEFDVFEFAAIDGDRGYRNEMEEALQELKSVLPDFECDDQ